MANILIYTAAQCAYCTRAKQLLDRKALPYQEIHVDTDEHARQEMEKRSGRRTVPQIFINGQSIGGFDDLSTLEKTGKLDTLLNKEI